MSRPILAAMSGFHHVICRAGDVPLAVISEDLLQVGVDETSLVGGLLKSNAAVQRGTKSCSSSIVEISMYTSLLRSLCCRSETVHTLVVP